MTLNTVVLELLLCNKNDLLGCRSPPGLRGAVRDKTAAGERRQQRLVFPAVPSGVRGGELSL